MGDKASGAGLQAMSSVFLIHGWSVTSTETYRCLHTKLAEHGWSLQAIHLGRYVSLDNDIEVRDLARALQRALIDALGPPPWADEIHFITHSTGALILRHWVVHHYVDEVAASQSVGNIVFLAGPHGGSRLAHHGRSLIAAVRFLGDTGKELLKALELGSRFTWQSNSEWMDNASWRDKGIRPFCLTGDRVVTDNLLQRIFSAGKEEGSDMVVRVPAGNANMQRFRFRAGQEAFEKVGEISGIGFCALTRYTHSGPEHGIMNSITADADPERPEYQNLRLILDCLKVDNQNQYRTLSAALSEQNLEGGRKGPYAQLVFRFSDQDGQPIHDYSVILGRGDNESAGAVVHVHKNKIDGSRLVVFIDTAKLDWRYRYFMDFHAETDSPLTLYAPEHFRVDIGKSQLEEIIRPDEVTEIEVVLPRSTSERLFRFASADTHQTPVSWNREGELER